MTKVRVSVFAAEEDAKGLDIASFAPKTAIDTKAPAAEEVRAVAHSAHFRSREAAPAKPEAPPKRIARRYRTGRNVQFNVKALQKTVDAFYSVSEAQGWVYGYTLQRAIEALQRELGSPA
jgi:hypothetical protein